MTVPTNDIPPGLNISPEGTKVYTKRNSEKRFVTLMYRKRDASGVSAAGFVQRVLGDLQAARVSLRKDITVTLSPDRKGLRFSCLIEVPVGPPDEAEAAGESEPASVGDGGAER